MLIYQKSLFRYFPKVTLLLFVITLFFLRGNNLATADPHEAQSITSTGEKSVREEKTVFEMSLDELLKMEIVTASKIPELLSETTSSVSVITADDLRRMGARTVYDALRTIPGISVDYNSRNMPVIEVRGVRKGSGTDNILFLLNGHSMNGVVSSGAPNIAMNDLPIANIKRIEVVRGPGSALYGTAAVIGVVNIITKGPDDIDGAELSFDTEFENEGNIGQKYNALFGKRFDNGIGFTLNLGTFDFDGPKQFIKPDALGNRGSGNTEHDAVDLQGTFEIGNLTLFGRYHTHDRAAFLTFTDVLSPDSDEKVNQAFLNAKMDFRPAEHTEITLTGYVDHRDVDWYYELFPAGSVPPPLFRWNRSGYISKFKWHATKTGGELMAVYRGVESHTLVAGLAGEYQNSHNIHHIANYNPRYLRDVQDVSDDFNWNRASNRKIYAGYVEDIWEITDRMRINLGARYDYYTDFEGTFNPRISLSWDFTEKCNLRLLYGEAFRAPDFGDRFSMNIGGASGDPDVDPEEIKTFEASLGVRFTKAFSGRLTYFHNVLDDLLGVPPGEDIVKNFASTSVDGLEVETRYDLAGGSFLTANYTFTDSRAKHVNRLSDVPRHRGNVTANWAIITHLNLYMNIYWQSLVPRASGDSRDSMSGYAVVNTTLMASNLWKRIDLNFSVYNLLNRDYTYPAPAGTVPGDYPAPGRSFLVGMKYRF